MSVPDHPSKNQRFPNQGIDVDSLERAPLDTMPAGSFNSSNVHSALYDFGDRALYIRYLRDAGSDVIYRYWDVPAQVWSGLQAASSKGSFVNANIATDYTYALYGRGDFPDTQSIRDGFLRGFLDAA